MVKYVIFKEKFHGKKIEGTYAKRFKNLKQAKREIDLWNGLTKQDQIIPLKISSKKPKGFRKNKYGILQKK